MLGPGGPVSKQIRVLVPGGVEFTTRWEGSLEVQRGKRIHLPPYGSNAEALRRDVLEEVWTEVREPARQGGTQELAITESLYHP